MDIRRILITSQDSISREGFKYLISRDKYSVVGERSSLLEALLDLRSMPEPVDLIVCDLKVNQNTEIDALKIIANEFPNIVTVALVSGDLSNDLQQAIRGIVRGILPSTISAAAMNLVFQLVLCGENLAAIPANLSDASMSHSPTAFKASYDLRIPLSQRENEILQFLKEGSPNKVIARKLDVAEATIKVHIKSLLRKIEVENRTQAAVWAMNHSSLSNAQF